MSHATNRVPASSAHGVRSGPRVIRRPGAAPAPLAANEIATGFADGERPLDPMLLVYRERVETFRRIIAALARGYRAVAGTS